MIKGGEIDWPTVKRVLVVRLRSIGDTVLITPTLRALRRALPAAEIDVLLEDWVAPVLDGSEFVDRVLSFNRSSKMSRYALAREIRRRSYDVAVNLHGGTTSALFVRVSGAPHRIGYGHYRHGFLYNHRLTSSAGFWGRPVTHSAEQHLALVGAFGIPVDDRPKTALAVTDSAAKSVAGKLGIENPPGDPRSEVRFPESRPIALIHPVAAFATKEWPTEKFGFVAGYLKSLGFEVIAVGAPNEAEKMERLRPVRSFCDLTLPEITALAARSAVFIGNDSGIAHIAVAAGCPSVVIFGSSNRDHWRPWTDTPHRVVFERFDCQPCAGYRCEKFDSPKCIESVRTEAVTSAIAELIGLSDGS